MKLQSMICPKCNGQLYFEEDQDTCFCSHCGTQVFKDDNGKRTFTYRTIDDAKIKNAEVHRDIKLKELEYKENADKRNTKFSLLFCLGGVIFFFLCMGMMVFIGTSENKKEQQLAEQGMISAGYCKDYNGKSYKYAVSMLEAKGFTNIETVCLEDATSPEQEGLVDSIAISGDDYFESKNYFYPDTKIVVFYH